MRKKKVVIQNPDEILDILESLPRVVAREEGPYTFDDRARDFLAVFSGASTAEQGQRVLSQLHQICDPQARLDEADKPGTLAFKSGMRRVFNELMLCFVVRTPLKIEKGANPKER